MTIDEEKQLNVIHKICLNDDHLLIPYSDNQLKMAKRAMEKMQAKLYQIADLIQVLCSD